MTTGSADRAAAQRETLVAPPRNIDDIIENNGAAGKD
jgi:hypothetical protein